MRALRSGRQQLVCNRESPWQRIGGRGPAGMRAWTRQFAGASWRKRSEVITTTSYLSQQVARAQLGQGRPVQTAACISHLSTAQSPILEWRAAGCRASPWSMHIVPSLSSRTGRKFRLNRPLQIPPNRLAIVCFSIITLREGRSYRLFRSRRGENGYGHRICMHGAPTGADCSRTDTNILG